MDILSQIGWVTLGIGLSVILPIALNVLKTTGGDVPFLDRLAGDWANRGWRALAVGLAAVVTAFALIALEGVEFAGWREAVVFGFAWDSLLGKIQQRRKGVA